MITRTIEHKVYENRWVAVFDDDVRFADGSAGRYTRIAASVDGPGVAILPLAQGRVGLVSVYRYPIGAQQWGIPRGFGSALDPVASARAELTEELGAGAGQARLEQLGVITPDSGLLDAHVAVFAAHLDAPVGEPLDRLEVAAVEWVGVADLWARVAAGRIQDGFTLAALTLAVSRGVVSSS